MGDGIPHAEPGGYGGWNPPDGIPQKKLNIDYYFLLLLKYFVVKNSFKRNSL